jgi:quercetin dioxygenase-like cupin family protein
MVVMEGVGRVQKRGEKAHDLHVGEIEFAGPGVEHWHGASPSEGVRYIHQSLSIDGGSGVYWMEEVTESDYLGNDIGISSRNHFLETGER